MAHGGRTPTRAWRATCHRRSTATPSPPTPNGPNGPVGNFSLIEVAELQFAFILKLLERLRSGGCARISATAEATEAFEATRVDAAKGTVWATGCRSWYLDDRGVPAAWPWTFQRFREVMAEPDIGDFDLKG